MKVMLPPQLYCFVSNASDTSLPESPPKFTPKNGMSSVSARAGTGASMSATSAVPMSLDESIYSSSMIRVAGAVRNIPATRRPPDRGRATQAHPVAGQAVIADLLGQQDRFLPWFDRL